MTYKGKSKTHGITDKTTGRTIASLLKKVTAMYIARVKFIYTVDTSDAV